MLFRRFCIFFALFLFFSFSFTILNRYYILIVGKPYREGISANGRYYVLSGARCLILATFIVITVNIAVNTHY